MWWMTLLVMFIGLMALFTTGLPIFVCFMIMNLAAVAYLIGPSGIGLFVNSMLETTTAEPLVAIPMFVLLGELMFRTGGVRVLFEAFDVLTGAIKGRLYIIAIGVAAFMGAISGSQMTSVAVLGRFVYPTMIERGCDRRMAIGTILSGATLDAIIPPSIVGIVLATLAGLSIADFLVAGIGPGLTLAACFMLYAVIRVWLNPSLDSAGVSEVETRTLTAKDKLRAALPVIPLLGIIFLVLGLVMFGIAQPTEAAAMGIAGALVMSVMFGTFSLRMLAETCFGAATTTGTVLIIVASSKLFSQLLGFTGAATGLVEFSLHLSSNPWVLYALMMLVVLILCMFIDQLAMILIFVPIYSPIINELGFDPLWFWMMFLVNILFGGVTPPMGYTMFVFKSAAPEVPMSEIYRSVGPIILVAAFGVLVMTIFPSIVTFLPSLK